MTPHVALHPRTISRCDRPIALGLPAPAERDPEFPHTRDLRRA
jgi:hypothetical protein